MRVRLLPAAALALAALFALTALTGCGTLHSWAEASAGRAPTAGASISMPLGK